MPVLKHTHEYIKYKGRLGYFRCNHPECTHFIDKQQLVGKLSLCTLCNSPFTLTPSDLQRARPRCINCSDTKEARAKRSNRVKAESFFNMISGTSELPEPKLEKLETEVEDELESEIDKF